MTRALPASSESERRACEALKKQIPVAAKHCANHPKREATVWAVFGTEPGLDLCESCFEARCAREPGGIFKPITQEVTA